VEELESAESVTYSWSDCLLQSWSDLDWSDSRNFQSLVSLIGNCCCWRNCWNYGFSRVHGWFPSWVRKGRR
jgi:hypothetical protein